MTAPMHVSLSHVSDTENLRYEKPYQIFAPIDETKFPRTNLTFEMCHGIEVRDARDDTERYTLDTYGFQFLSSKYDWGLDVDKIILSGDSNNAIVSEYLRRLSTQLQETLGAEKIILYDWRVKSCPH
ncbi:hypothetical protein F5884DRAFT_879168 [Xylogone sp. PMI_703]|nr:hypothetical protein F5884DRAFT_879168 [Xylogone sp. PMI_703]